MLRYLAHSHVFTPAVRCYLVSRISIRAMRPPPSIGVYIHWKSEDPREEYSCLIRLIIGFRSAFPTFVQDRMTLGGDLGQSMALNTRYYSTYPQSENGCCTSNCSNIVTQQQELAFGFNLSLNTVYIILVGT